MRGCVWLLMMVCASFLHGAEANRGRTVDLTLRYVNDEIISLGDVLQRNSLRLADYERRGRPRPANLKELIAFAEQSLNDLTDEELLIQYGRQMARDRGFELVDHERISQMVMEAARRSGRGMSLRQQAEERREIERQQIIGMVLDFFSSRTPHIAPQDIERSYKEREPEFRRPARAKVYQIIIRPSSTAERQEVRQARIAVFKAAQDATDAAVRAASESRIEAYTVASAEEQERLLTEAVQEIARQASRADLNVDSLKLARQAAEAEQRAAALRDADTARRDLEKLRGELQGKDLAAFAEAAKQYSQGPGAADGGALGWVEPGTYQSAFDEVVFSIKPGQLSEVFIADRLAYLVLVTDRNEASHRAFGEVVGEIENALLRNQEQAARDEAVRMLRAKALVRDITTIQQVIN